VPEWEFSGHAKDMLTERSIREEWVLRVLNSPRDVQHMADGTTHYIGPIEENENRMLRVVANTRVRPQRVITTFFDRRLQR
jgi:hypothetical protein